MDQRERVIRQAPIHEHVFPFAANLLPASQQSFPLKSTALGSPHRCYVPWLDVQLKAGNVEYLMAHQARARTANPAAPRPRADLATQ